MRWRRLATIEDRFVLKEPRYKGGRLLASITRDSLGRWVLLTLRANGEMSELGRFSRLNKAKKLGYTHEGDK